MKAIIFISSLMIPMNDSYRFISELMDAFLNNLDSQTTWLKVELKLVNFLHALIFFMSRLGVALLDEGLILVTHWRRPATNQSAILV